MQARVLDPVSTEPGHRVKPQLASILAVSSLLTATPLLAADEEPQALEPVVVTGTRTEHRLSDSPVDVQLITEEDIRRSGARDVAELLEREGGVYVTRVAGRGSSIEIQGLAAEHVLILLNGQLLTTADVHSGIALFALGVIASALGLGLIERAK